MCRLRFKFLSGYEAYCKVLFRPLLDIFQANYLAIPKSQLTEKTRFASLGEKIAIHIGKHNNGHFDVENGAGEMAFGCCRWPNDLDQCEMSQTNCRIVVTSFFLLFTRERKLPRAQVTTLFLSPSRSFKL